MALRNIRPQAEVPDQAQDASVRAYIDDTLTGLLRELTLPPSEGQPSITLRSRPDASSCIVNPVNGALETVHSSTSYRTYTWPGNTAYESWKFTVVIRVLSVIDQCLRESRLISKRDIYYIDPAYFQTQTTINNVVDDIAYTIGVNRLALNVEAAGKGLIAGSFLLLRDSVVVLNAQSVSEDNLVPRIQDNDKIDVSNARWVLVIEKEAVFHRLVRNNYHNKALAGQGILITGKGYPDICTRQFLHKLSKDTGSGDHRRLRFYALTDGDPHGLAIISTYKYGSLAYLHENAGLTLPCLQWLGLKLADTANGTQDSSGSHSLTLTIRDRKKIISMLRRSPIWASDGAEPEWCAELQRMLMLNVKVEIEKLYDEL
ncbi:hypothetical protein PENSTE_c015G00811 [Penicillium steckii]|uniref:DNA topoisomerase (ATP-hydrolyzing) n=1 Tax=Penicillium steckii TaxID=303698 RepID=A0A1V6T0N8_9EURO|nr:hypothetical protein PENSTE_c015G00811 [Penicillium steckii]